MSKTVVSKDGESIISIAGANGYADWHTVYDANENADLRKKRPDPSVQAAGDEIFLPDFEALTLTLSAPGTYTIHTKSLYAQVHMLLNDPSGNPYAAKNWELKVNDRVYKGTTDAEGTVQQKVPASAIEGALTLFLDDAGEHKLEWTVEISGLDSVDTDGGAQTRLNNLGYHTGDDEKGTVGESTKRAVSNFQNDHGLEMTGELDQATRARLQEEHHS
jgi:hypothetical protein